MSERNKIFDLREAFCLVDAIKVINGCGSVLALDALRKVIDRRIAKLERAGSLVEQNPLKSGQTPLKMGQKKQRGGAHQRIYGEEDVLKNYGTTKIFKPVLDAVLGGVKEPFTQDDISVILVKHYREALKRDLAASSAGSYAFLYVKYMLSESLIERDGALDHKGKGRANILYRKTPRKVKPEGVKNGIYEAADDGKRRLKENLGLERELCDSGHFEDLPEVTDGGA